MIGVPTTDFPPYDLAILADPFPHHAALQDVEPVF